ncbi:MAG: hypothetical protein QOI48_2877 [Solirubrobacteraceae bacterium]|jgi:hypothetical protein|nr:hypothetical protein [Solirubrobacteraceae bacterium]
MIKLRHAMLTLAALGVTLAIAVPALAAAPRIGILHLTKECSEYTGEAGSFCTITSSNLNAFPVGTHDIAVAAAAADGALNTDLIFDTGTDRAFGHLVICGPCRVGKITFDGGTGAFKTFHARLVIYCPASRVTLPDGRVVDCRIDGLYWFAKNPWKSA